MARVLIPFAEPEGALRAVAQLLREPRDPSLHVHLLAAVEPRVSGMVRIFVTRQRAEELVREAARCWLQPLEAVLSAANVPYSSEIAVGPPRATIRAATARTDIDRVVLPPSKPGVLARLSAAGSRTIRRIPLRRLHKRLATMRGSHSLSARSRSLPPRRRRGRRCAEWGALSPLWVVPFAGILLSIAVAPVTAPAFWHHHFGKTTAFWALAFLIPFAANYGVDLAAREVVHTLLLEYVPFIVLLLALFTVSAAFTSAATCTVRQRSTRGYWASAPSWPA